MIPWQMISKFILGAEKCSDPDSLAKYVFYRLRPLIQFDSAVLLILDQEGACQHCYQTEDRYQVKGAQNSFQQHLVQRISREYHHHYPSIEECVLNSRQVVEPRLQKCMKQLKICEAFGLGLWNDDGQLRCIFSLERRGDESFSYRDRQVVNIIFHHLNNLYQNLGTHSWHTDVSNLGLTKRETEVAGLLMDGLTNERIAGQLEISPATVAKHIANMHQKLGVQTQQELLVKLFQASTPNV